MDTDIAQKQTLERLHGLVFDDDTLTIRVSSSGCTNKDDFKIRVRRGSSGKAAPTLEIVRIKPDLCRAFTRVIELSFSWEELGLDATLVKGEALKVANPFGAL